MSFNESEASEANTTQPELTELYQQTQKAQPKTEQQPKPSKALAKGSTSEQLESAIADAQKKALESGKVGTKAAVATGKERGKKLLNAYEQSKALTLMNGIAESEIKTADQLLNGISSFSAAIDEASGDDIKSLLYDEDEEITLLKKRLEEELKHSKKSETTNNFLFG